MPIQKIPRFISHTKPTPPDEVDAIGQAFFPIGISPTSPDHSDRLLPSHNPLAVGSIPTGPTPSQFTSLLTYETVVQLAGAV